MEVFNGNRLPKQVVPVLVSMALLSAFATAGAQTGVASPAPRLQFQSVLSGYRAFNDQPVQAWRDTNDQVRNIGGWRAYAREAAEAPPIAEESQKTPAPSGLRRGSATGASPPLPAAPAGPAAPVAPAVVQPPHRHDHGSKP